MSRRRTSSGAADYKLLVNSSEVVDYDDEDEMEPMIESEVIKEQISEEPPLLLRVAAFLCVVPVFSGYACGVALQRELKVKLNIGGTKALDESPEAHMFSRAVTLLTLGNLMFRLGHNLVFCCFGARTRVMIAISSIMSAMFIISVVICWAGQHHLAWVFVSYGLIGMGIGTFESNLLAEISGLGRQVTLWAVSGMPVGFMMITIVGFVVKGWGVPVEYLYLCTAMCLLCSLLIFVFFIPHAKHTQVKSPCAASYTLKDLGMMIYRIAPHSFALMIDMFSFSLFCPQLVLYLFQSSEIRMNYWLFSFVLKREYFLALVNTHTSLGDTLGRKLVYLLPEKITHLFFFPWVFLLFTALGIGCNVSNHASLTPLGCFFIALGNGTVYAQSCRFIHSKVSLDMSIAALSVWLFVGDIGSVVAYLTKDYIQPLFG